MSATVTVAPGGLPGLGHAIAVLRDPLGFVARLSELGGIVLIRLGTRPIHVVTSPALVHEMLAAHGNDCPRGSLHDTISANFGEGLLAIDGPPHREHRRTLRQCFRPKKIAEYVGTMDRVAREHVDRWEPGQIIEVAEEMQLLTLDSVTATLFDIRLRDDTLRRFLRHLPHMVKGLVIQAMYPWAVLTRLPLPVNRQFTRSVNALLAAVDEVLDRRETGGDDMVTTLRGSFDHDVVRAEVITMFVAATETTSVTLTWLFHELDQNPEIRSRVVAEVTEQLADVEDLTAEHLTRLTYTARVMREVLRRHAPNAFLMREATGPVRLGDYDLPTGSELLFCLTAIHRDPSTYPDPLRFDPDRWLPERRSAIPRTAYFPFGAGRHKCIGEEYALAELLVVAVHVLRRWCLTTTPGAHVHEVTWTTVQPRGLRMSLATR